MKEKLYGSYTVWDLPGKKLKSWIDSINYEIISVDALGKTCHITWDQGILHEHKTFPLSHLQECLKNDFLSFIEQAPKTDVIGKLDQLILKYE